LGGSFDLKNGRWEIAGICLNGGIYTHGSQGALYDAAGELEKLQQVNNKTDEAVKGREDPTGFARSTA
jgi:hypothetical protein